MNKSAILGFGIGLAACLVVGGFFYFQAQSANQTSVVNVPPKTAAPAISKATGKPLKPANPLLEPPADGALKPAADEPGAKIAMTREIVNGGTYSSGGTVDVTVTIAKEGNKDIRAMGLVENLPAGWTYDSVVSGNPPDLLPTKGRTPTLEYAWFNIPSFPVTFTYRVQVAGSGDVPQEITGQALYRTDGPELRTEVVTSVLAPGAPAPASANTGALSPDPAAAAKSAADAKPALSGTGMEMARTVARGKFTPGTPLEVQVTMNYGLSDAITALAVVETLPQGWTFGKVTGGTPPAVSPPEGSTGVLNFVWINIPAWPATFTYTVTPPATDTGAKRISGQVLYRGSNAQEQTPTLVTEVTP